MSAPAEEALSTSLAHQMPEQGPRVYVAGMWRRLVATLVDLLILGPILLGGGWITTRLTGLKLLGPQAIHVFHMNDYPADPPRATINDSHRVYPGDGVAPLKQILRTLDANGCRCVLSLELFNRDYWKQDAEQVAKTGLEKMRAAVADALG